MTTAAKAPPRPPDPDLLYAEFARHQTTCTACTDTSSCPYGEHLLEAWGDAERFYAAEQAAIEAVQPPFPTPEPRS